MSSHPSPRSDRGRSPHRHRCAPILLGLLISLLCFTAPALAATTGITGTVTDHASGQPLPRIQVNALDASGALIDSTCTDAAGQYTFGGLAPGAYTVGFESTAGDFRVCGGQTNYLPQFWRAASTLAGATSIDVSAGTTVGGIDAAMDPGGAIAGTVTDATNGTAAPGVEVDAFDSSGSLVSSTCTGSDGSYALFALATGDYRVEYRNTSTCGSGTAFRIQYYSGQTSLAAADAVHVLVTQTTTGINAALIPVSSHTLTVTFAGPGSGSVQFSPYTVFCTRTCVLPLTGTHTVTLTAAPTSGSSFAGWSGSGCSGTWSCAVRVGSDVAVTATFARTARASGSASGGSSGSSSGTSGTGRTGGAGSTGPGGAGGRGPKCTVAVVSAHIKMVRPAPPRRHGRRGRRGHRQKLKPAVPTLRLSYRCDQAVHLSESASARVTTKVRFVRRTRTRTGSRSRIRTRTRTRTIRMRGRSWAHPAPHGTLAVTVPAAVLRAARTRATVSVRFTVRYGNTRGSATATAVIAHLRAR